MQTHDDLIKQLIEAAQQGRDPIPILRAQRDHVEQCPTCRALTDELVRSVFDEDDLLFMQLVRLEQQGQLAELIPAAAAVPAPASIWRSTGQSIRELASGINLRVKVSRGEMAARFAGLSGWLSSSVVATRSPLVEPARRNVRQGRVGSGQELTIPDTEWNVRITLAVQATNDAKSDLRVEVRTLEPDEPVDRAQVALRPTKRDDRDEMKESLDEMPTNKDGRAAFPKLDPGQYDIEIGPIRGRHGANTWRLTVAIESA